MCAQWRIIESRRRLVGWWLALEGGYGTRLVEEDARHSRQHLEDETTDRTGVAGRSGRCLDDVWFQVA